MAEMGPSKLSSAVHIPRDQETLVLRCPHNRIHPPPHPAAATSWNCRAIARAPPTEARGTSMAPTSQGDAGGTHPQMSQTL